MVSLLIIPAQSRYFFMSLSTKPPDKRQQQTFPTTESWWVATVTKQQLYTAFGNRTMHTYKKPNGGRRTDIVQTAWTRHWTPWLLSPLPRLESTGVIKLESQAVGRSNWLVISHTPMLYTAVLSRTAGAGEGESSTGEKSSAEEYNSRSTRNKTLHTQDYG